MVRVSILVLTKNGMPDISSVLKRHMISRVSAIRRSLLWIQDLRMRPWKLQKVFRYALSRFHLRVSTTPAQETSPQA